MSYIIPLPLLGTGLFTIFCALFIELLGFKKILVIYVFLSMLVLGPSLIPVGLNITKMEIAFFASLTPSMNFLLDPFVHISLIVGYFIFHLSVGLYSTYRIVKKVGMTKQIKTILGSGFM